MSPRGYVTAAVALLTVVLAFETGLVLAARRRPPLVVDVGPTIAPAGFGGSLEYGQVTARSPMRRAVIDLPLDAEAGPATVELCYARLGHTPMKVIVSVSGRRAEDDLWTPAGPWTFSEWFQPGRTGTPFTEMHVARLPVHIPSGPLRIGLATEPADELALPIDWIRLDGVSWTLPMRVAPWPRLLVVGIFVVVLAARGPLAAAVLAAALLAIGQAVAAAHDPIALAHVSARLAVPAFVLGMIAALAFRTRPAAWALVSILLAGYLVKGAGIFHPAHRHADVLSHSRYVQAFGTAEGSLYERGTRAQLEARVGLRPISGRWRPHPYSPVFYLPFTWARERITVEEAMKHAALAAAAVEVLLVFLLATRIFGPPAGLWAALLAAFLPPLHSRLLIAMFPTVVGHAFDTLAIVAAAAFAAEPSRRRVAVWTAASLLSLLTYITAIFNLGAFSAAWMALSRKRAAVPVILWMLLAAAATLALYGPFLPVFFREVLPMLGGSAPEAEPGRWAGLLGAFGKILFFYGWGYPVLVAAGLAVARRRAPAPLFHVLAAYGLAVLALVFLRGLSLGVMKDLKEMEFAGPFVASCAGGALAWLAAKGRTGAAIAAGVAVWLVSFGLHRHEAYRRVNLSSSHDLVLAHQQAVRPPGPVRGHVVPAEPR